MSRKIRACQIPPIAQKRPDIPSALPAVLDVALAADPANRFASATAFAHALAQVMKHALGVDPQSALGNSVREMKATGRPRMSAAFSAQPEVELSLPDLDVEPIELTKPKSKG